jgi:hypothetical protein
MCFRMVDSMCWLPKKHSLYTATRGRCKGPLERVTQKTPKLRPSTGVSFRVSARETGPVMLEVTNHDRRQRRRTRDAGVIGARH